MTDLEEGRFIVIISKGEYKRENFCLDNLAHVYLRYLCLFTHSGVQHILCCVFVSFSSACVQCAARFCGFSIFLLPLRYFLTFFIYTLNSKIECFEKDILYIFLYNKISDVVLSFSFSGSL